MSVSPPESAAQASAAAAPPVGPADLPWGGLGGGGRIGHAPPGVSCISRSEQERARAAIDAYELRKTWTQGPATDAPLKYAFYPQAGTLDRDILIGNFVDLDGTSGIRDYDCSNFSYDTHQGIDSGLRNFTEQDVGVPIFAAADGVVVDILDGNPDKSTTWEPKPANYVIIDHGSGRYAYYWHMKKDSVAVSTGQTVVAGQQIGQVGSSGVSGGPHLHFENRDLPSFSTFEPFAGACRPGDSGWTSQPPLRRAIFAMDGGVTHVDLATHTPTHPYEVPGGGQMSFADPLVYVWVMIPNLPAQSNWRMRFIRPSGTLAFQSAQFDFGNPAFYRWSLWWFRWNIAELRSITGTWRVELDINGGTVVSMPFIVVPTRDPLLNRPPATPAGLAFDPPAPRAGDVIFCRLDAQLVNDDPDFDVVRYRYEWFVDGVKVRDVINASHSDALRRDAARAGQRVTCTVTPSDGKVSVPSREIAVRIAIPCRADCSGDGRLDIADFTCFQNAFALGDLAKADCDTTGTLDVRDFTCYQNLFALGCP